MLKKFSLFALAAIILTACSSEKEEEKRTFQDAVYAFMNSNPNLIAFGKVEVNAIMEDGALEKNSMFQMFAATTYDELKLQVDLKTPLYMAMEAPEEGGDPNIFVMAKLKDAKKFEEYWTTLGYNWKEHKGMRYAEDNEQLMVFRDDLLVVVMIPRKYDGKKFIARTFKYVDGEIAPDKLKKQIDAPGDFVMHFDFDRMQENDPSMPVLPKGLDADISLNFEKGKMVFEATSDDAEKLQKQFNIETLKAPIVSKKIVDGNGNVVMAMQVSARSSLTDMMNMNDDNLEEAMAEISASLAELDATLTMSDITADDVILMPETGKPMGGEAIQMFVDLDMISAKIPEYGTHFKSLDYASYEMKDNKIRVVIASHNENENFLKTTLEAVDAFMMSGGLMQLAAMN